MSTYTTVYRALVSGRAVPASEAAQLLADLRQDHGTEFAGLLQAYARETYSPTATEAHGDARRRKRAYGAISAATRHVVDSLRTPRT